MLASFSLLFLLIALVNSQNLSYDQTAILLSLKQHWGNPPSLDSWNSLSSPCDWPEVVCDSAGTAIILYLGDKNLKGTIPSAICQLKNLVSIDLWMNKLSGPIPSCLDNCSNLEFLELSMNEVSGTIPSAICQLRKLTRIVLGMNKLSGHIPSCLDNCSNLETFDFSDNELSGTIPSAICQLKNLVSIDLQMNKLLGRIPSCLDNCSNLENLDLSDNELSGTIPSTLCQLRNLVQIDLSKNKLSGRIPACLYNCSNLEVLSLSMNVLSGTIPSAICQLKNLVRIMLGINKLSGHIPACLYNCSYLQRLDLSMNELYGTIPSELFLMQKLNYLNITSNRLFGWLPTPIQAYSLSYIDLSHNNLNGSIPDDVTNLYYLRLLDLSMNSLSGSIPSGLFHMYQLNDLSLAHNNLTGELELPALLGRLFSLQRLNLSHNHLYGVLPESFVHLFQLNSLDLSDNQLSGGIVQSLCHLRSTSTIILRLCSNRFSGKISSEFVNGAFAESCLDSSNICFCNKNESLPDCPSNLCSADSSFRSLLNCNNIESDNNSTRTTRTMATTKTVAEAIVCGIVGFVIFGYIARKCWKMARATIASRRNIILPLNDKDKEWEMISFQKLDFSKPDILSNLTDENLIGNGGSGKVYRVVINQTGNTVAVKSIWNDKKSDERLEKEFMAEIQTLGTIWHNNIVKLLCYISGNNTQLLVYQYFQNQSLDQWLHGKKKEISSSEHCSITKLDWPMRLNVAIGVAQGLCYMHHHCSPPIIHRDIKSSNILLDSEFNAKIADFGMAKLLTRSGDPETASAVVGTFGYIAPEYAYTKRVDVKSDVYSFGVVLLELTTGRKAVRPDDHMNLAGWAQIHYRETAYVVDSLDDEIKESSLLDQIVAVFRLGVMCTTKTPANRPSMKDCLNILQDYSSCCSSSDSMT